MRRRRMAVPIAEMERFAMGGDSLRFDGGDIGNVIELGDMGMGDDFGLGGLANTSFTKAPQEGRTVNLGQSSSSSSSSSSSAARGTGISYGSSSGGFGGLETIDVTPLEPLEPIRLATMEPETINVNDFGSSGAGPSISFTKEGGSSFGGPGPSLFDNSQSATGPGIQLSSGARDPNQEKKDKGDFLNKLQRLEQKGFPVSRKFTMDNSLEEIKTEYFRLVDARNLEISIKFQRQMLMGAVTGLEWLNGRFDPFDLKLDGWSESVNESLEDFDEIFEELYDKYKDKGKMSPEVQLVMKLAGSGFMCHISNSFFRRNMPSMDDVLRRNPELARQMAAAAASAAAPGFGNFMGMAMGVTPGGMGAGMGGPGPIGPEPSSGIAPPPLTPVGGFNAASAAAPVAQPPMPRAPAPVNPLQAATGRPTARPEMKGPTVSGVEDILSQFEQARAQEAMAARSMEPAGGMSTGPAVAAVVSGAVSIGSGDDMMSQAESVRTGGTASGRRRRRTAAPTGNTFSVDV